MPTKENSEKEFPGLPSYYTSRNPPSEVQVKWVLNFIRNKLYGQDTEVMKDFGISAIIPLPVDSIKPPTGFSIIVQR